MNHFTKTKRLWIVIPVVFGAAVICAWMLGGLAWCPQHFARQALVQRDYQRAWDWTQTARRLDTLNAETEFLQARIERKRGHIAEALRHLKRAETLGADRSQVRRELVLVQAQTGDLSDILVELDQMLIHHSDDGADICEAYVNGLLINGQLENAEVLIQQWTIAFPADPQPDHLRGRIAEFRKQPAQAERHYRAALVKQAHHFPSAYGLGRVLIEVQRWSEALDEFEKCLAFPVRGPAQLGMARALTGAGREDDALILLREAARTPRDVWFEASRQLGETTEYDNVSFELGVLEAKGGRHSEAIRWLQQAFQHNPRHMQARYQLALSLNSVGRGEEAKPHFQWRADLDAKLSERDRLHDLVERHSDDFKARIRLGELYLETESEAAGLLWLRGVLADEPQNQSAHAILADWFERKAQSQPEYQGLAQHHRALAGSAVNRLPQQ